VETVEELQAAMARATAHVAVGDGVQCEQRRGQVVRSGLLSYTVQWEDGAVEDYEQRDSRLSWVRCARCGGVPL
jgi:hypothetical protein